MHAGGTRVDGQAGGHAGSAEARAAPAALRRRKTGRQWSETVEKMVGYGAKVGSDSDFDAIVRYLTRYYRSEGRGGGGGKR